MQAAFSQKDPGPGFLYPNAIAISEKTGEDEVVYYVLGAIVFAYYHLLTLSSTIGWRDPN
jgi:hypothetical protein